MQFVRIRDTVINHRVHGLGSKKPVILFINSLGTDFRIWDQVVAELASDFTLVLFDKRGHGLSDLGKPPYSIDDFADDAIGLLDHYGLSDVVLCGLSVGGLISLSIFYKRPDLVRGIFFADTAHKIGTPEFWETRIRAVLDNGIGSILEPIMSRWFTAPYRQPENADYQGYCTMLVRQSAEGYAGTCAAIRDANFTETARRINVPTLCVVGAEDGSTPPDLVRSLAELIPNSQFEIIPKAAHLPCIEAPAEFLRLLRRFLSTVPGVSNG